MRRDDLLVAYVAEHLHDVPWVDIGAGYGIVTQQLRRSSKARGECYDIVEQPKHGVRAFDGKLLPVDSDSFGFAILNFVLHHADEPERLVEEALRVAPVVLIQEDLRDGSVEVDELLAEHSGGSFYSHEQWPRVLQRCGGVVTHSELFPTRHLKGLADYPVPRALYVVERAPSPPS